MAGYDLFEKFEGKSFSLYMIAPCFSYCITQNDCYYSILKHVLAFFI